MIKKLALLIST